MEISKDSKLPKITCPICKNILGVKPEDFKHKNHFSMECYFYTCPVCQKTSFIFLKDLPKSIQENLQKAALRSGKSPLFRALLLKASARRGPPHP